MKIDFVGIIIAIAIAKVVNKNPDMSIVEVANKICNALSFIENYSKEDKEEMKDKVKSISEFIKLIEK